MKKYSPLVLAALTVVLVQVGIGAWMWRRFGAPADAAAFGDMFGAVNTLFAGLAFAGVIYAIILQQQELKLQREELADTRAEIARSATAQEESQAALREQVDVAKQQAEAIYRPYVAVRVEPTATGNSLRLVVLNTGQTAALTLVLKLDEDFVPIGFGSRRKEMALSSRSAFREIIPTFPPGSRLEFPLVDLFAYRHRDEGTAPTMRDLSFVVSATYGYPGTTVHEDTEIDLRPYLESEPPVSDPAGRALEKMAQSLGKMEPRSGAAKDFDQGQQNAKFDKLVKAIDGVGDETKKLTAKVDKLGGGSSSDPMPKALAAVATEIKNIHSMLKSKLR